MYSLNIEIQKMINVTKEKKWKFNKNLWIEITQNFNNETIKGR